MSIGEEVWLDVTEQVKLSMRCLEQDFVANTNFQLIDAMAAVEVGDPRMDVSVTKEVQLTTESVEFSDLLEIVSSPARTEIFCGILLGHFFAWMNESAYFSQSVWQCVLAHAPEKFPVSEAKDFLMVCMNILAPVVRERFRVVATEEEFSPALNGRFSTWKYETVLGLALVPFTLAKFIESPDVQKLEDLKAAVSVWQKNEYSTEDILQVEKLFNVSISRPYWPHGPPRSLRKIDFREIHGKLSELIDGFIFVFENIPNADNFLANLEIFSEKFGKNLSVRAVAEAVFFSSINFGEIFIRQLPSLEISKAPDFAAFVTEAGIMLEIVTRQFLKLPARLNRNIKKMVPRLSQLLRAGHAIDGDLAKIKPVLMPWSAELMTAVLEYQLRIGFSLELYDESELGMIYWLLDYLMNIRLQMAPQPESLERRVRFAVLTLEKHMFMAMFKVLTVLECVGILKVSPALAAAKRHRFEMRTVAFEKARELLNVDFSVFEKSANLKKSDAGIILKSALEMMNQVSTKIAALPEIPEKSTIKRVAIANQLAVKQILQNLEISTISVATSFKYHSSIAALEVRTSL